MTVIHQQVYTPGMFGGVQNSTLCGRVSNATSDMNVGGAVTCKMCIEIAGRSLKTFRMRFVGMTYDQVQDLGPYIPTSDMNERAKYQAPDRKEST